MHPIDGHSGKATEPDGSEIRGTILVVDDDATVLDFIGTALRRQGYRVLLASDGQEALAASGGHACGIDAIVLDIIMPMMAANDLIPALRSRWPNAKILLNSGYSEAQARRLCAAYPSAAFIQKPYTAQQIVRVVDGLLAGRN